MSSANSFIGYRIFRLFCASSNIAYGTGYSIFGKPCNYRVTTHDLGTQIDSIETCAFDIGESKIGIPLVWDFAATVCESACASNYTKPTTYICMEHYPIHLSPYSRHASLIYLHNAYQTNCDINSCRNITDGMRILPCVCVRVFACVCRVSPRLSRFMNEHVTG